MKRTIVIIILLSLSLNAQEKWYVWDAPRIDFQKPFISFYEDNLFYLSLDGMFFKSDPYFNSKEFSFLPPFEVDVNFKPVSKKNFLFVDENIGFFIFKTNEIYKTVDGGVNWELQSNLTGNMIEYTKDGVLFLFDRYIYKSYDKGKTWIKLPASNNYFDYGDPIDLVALDSLNIWVIKKQEYNTFPPQPTTINCYTTDGGYTWNKFNENIITSFRLDYLAIMFNEDGIGFISGEYLSAQANKIIPFILKTSDNGRTWNFNYMIENSISDIFYQNGEWLFFPAYKSGYYLSTDDLNSAPSLYNSNKYYDRKFYHSSQELLYTISWNSFSINTGSFENINDYNIQFNSMPDFWFKYDHQTNSAFVYKSNESSQFLFENEKSDYTPINLDWRFLSNGLLQFHSKTFYTINNNQLLSAGNYGRAPLEITPLYTNSLTTPKYTVYDDNSFFVVSPTNLYYYFKDDYLKQFSSPFMKEIKITSLVQYDNDKLLAVGNYFEAPGFLRTEDGAKTWSFIESDYSFSTIQKFNDSTLLATNGSNIYSSTDFGITWNSIYKEVYESYILDFNIYNDSTLLLSTSQGIKVFDMNSGEIKSEFKVHPYFKSFKEVYLINEKLIIGKTQDQYFVKVTDFNLELPEKSFNNSSNQNPVNETNAISNLLSQNYPNPFNPITNINYYVMDNEFVSLKVYDVLGNEIAVLVNEMKSKGNYQAAFDGSNLPSGLYIYKLNVGSYSQVKKMMLLK